MAKPRVGSSYTYGGAESLGQAARIADPDIDHTKPAVVDGVNMAWLDMPSGTPVKVCGHDDDRDLVLVEWTDSAGSSRITSITPEQFESDFQKG
jgi:hypothetical protein